MQNNQTARRRRTFFRCWWLRFFGLLLFVIGAHYAPAHLALESHWGNATAYALGAETRPVGLAAKGQDDDSHHKPHQASDHSLRMASRAQVCHVFFDACVVTTSVEVYRPMFQLPLFLTERQNPPGLPPPDPLQPRAPPLA